MVAHFGFRSTSGPHDLYGEHGAQKGALDCPVYMSFLDFNGRSGRLSALYGVEAKEELALDDTSYGEAWVFAAVAGADENQRLRIR